MKTENLSKGTESNLLEFLVDNIEIKPYSKMKGGIIENGMYVKMGSYNLENILCQMLDDYGEEKLIERIKALN